MTAIDISVTTKFYWSDSTIVLSWLRLEPRTLKTFISNRVAEIQSLTSSKDWYHVTSQDNPADLLSRGINPRDIQGADQWWHGPRWLSSPELKFSEAGPPNHNCLELKPPSKVTIVAGTDIPLIQFERFSSLSKLKRVVAYCKRFINHYVFKKPPGRSRTVTADELHASLLSIVRVAQKDSFMEELRQLAKKHALDRKSALSGLNPFLSPEGILRVGGRLENSKFSYDQRHPKILSAKHPLTRLIFAEAHLRNLHAGPQALLACVRQGVLAYSGSKLSTQNDPQLFNLF